MAAMGVRLLRNGPTRRLLLGLPLALGVLLGATSEAGRGWPGNADAVAGPVPARVLAVIDGDTIAVRARIWIGQDVVTRVRIAGVDAPELNGGCPRERALASEARDFVADAIDAGVVTLRDIRYDKYGGRVLARVANSGGQDLATLLIAAGLGRAYDGGARASWCEEASSGS